MNASFVNVDLDAEFIIDATDGDTLVGFPLERAGPTGLARHGKMADRVGGGTGHGGGSSRQGCRHGNGRARARMRRPKRGRVGDHGSVPVGGRAGRMIGREVGEFGRR